MDVSSTTTSFQNVNTYQQPIKLDQAITPEGESSVVEEQQVKSEVVAAEEQVKKEDTRGNVVDYTASQSKKSQIEISFVVEENSDVQTQQDTATSIKNLRETQKQNDVVEAYSKYQENQQGKPVLF